MPDDIESFSGDYRWLSNFHPCKIKYGGLVYPSVEHAYQAAKAPPDGRTAFLGITASQAKHLGRRKACVPDWDNWKASIMRENADKPIGTPEAIAYADPRYATHLTVMKEAIERDEYCRWMRTAAEAKIEAWRTMSANNRILDKIT